MADFLIELLGAALDGLIPKRTNEILVSIVLVIVALAFAAIACFALFQAIQTRQLGLLVFTLIFGALAALSIAMARKSFRQTGSPPE